MIHSSSSNGPPGTGTGTGRGVRILTAATMIACWLLVVLGDTVRVTESGMGCRSWPLCNGSAGLSGSYHALLEQSHRYGATIVTVLVLASFAAVRRGAAGNRAARRAATAAVAAIVLQIVFGAITVLSHNAGWTVALHLTGAWLLLAAVTVTAVTIEWGGRARGSARAHAGRRRWRLLATQRGGLIASLAVLLLALSGMLVLHGQASDACRSWPLCLGSHAPSRLLALQYLHRGAGLIATLAVILCALPVWRAAGPRSAGRLAAAAALALLAVTAAFGGVVAVTGAPAYAEAIHLALASALWSVVVAIATLQGIGAAAAARGDREKTGTSSGGAVPLGDPGVRHPETVASPSDLAALPCDGMRR